MVPSSFCPMTGDQVKGQLESQEANEWRQYFSQDQRDFAEAEPWYDAHLKHELATNKATEAQTPNPIEVYQQTRRAAGRLLAVLVVVPILATVMWVGGKAALTAYETYKLTYGDPQKPVENPQPAQPSIQQPANASGPFRPATQAEFMRLLRGNSLQWQYLQRPILPLNGRGMDVPIVVTNPLGGYEIIEEDWITYSSDGWIERLTTRHKDTGQKVTFVCQMDTRTVRGSDGRDYSKTDFPGMVNPNPTRYRNSTYKTC